MSAQDQLLEVVMRELARRRALGPVRVLALDPCPMCCGQIVASETVACCRSCGWSYRENGPEPLASRRANP